MSIESVKPLINLRDDHETDPHNQYGDIERLLLEGEAEILGDIDELYAEITAPHFNKVDIAAITPKEYNNSLKGVRLTLSDKQELLCVYKSFRGENQAVKSQLGFQQYYPQEVLTYWLSEHFRYGVVPATVERTIKDDVGALQLFINPLHFGPWKKIYHDISDLSEEEEDQFTQARLNSESFRKIALLDWQALIGDRNQGNLLIEASYDQENNRYRVNPARLPEHIAIDHGESFSSTAYNVRVREKTITSAAYQLTHQRITDPSGYIGSLEVRPNYQQIEPELLTLVEDGLRRRQEFHDRYDEDINRLHIPPEWIEEMWMRSRALLETGSYLSAFNLPFPAPTAMREHPRIYRPVHDKRDFITPQFNRL